MSQQVALAELPVPAAVVDGAGAVVEASPSFASLFGGSAVDLEGRDLATLLAPEDGDRWRLALGESSADLIVAGRGFDGLPVVVDLRLGERYDDVGRVVVGGRRDPVVVRADDVDTPAIGRAEVDRLVSHDIRGALRGVAGFLALVDREREALSEQSAEFLDTARRSTETADRMAARLVEDLRLAQRVLPVEPVDLESVVADAVEGRPIEVDVGVLPEVMANRGLIAQLVDELLDNASKFGASHVDIGSHVDDGWVRLSVDDDGPGVAVELREPAFDMFRLLQAKGEYPGVGAGLAICRRIAEIHGGRIAMGDVAAGCRIEVRLPGTS